MNVIFVLLAAIVRLIGPVGIIASLVVLLLGQLGVLTSLVLSLASAITGLASIMTGTGLAQIFGFANRVIPLTEGVWLLAFLLGIRAIAALVRIVKSVIPTIS